ncbi:hypothetical protein [Aeromicrobium alkaliterrae]|uniref:Uncharacterized protein n=1 Tax=Aeromicrobium alkaliterrae TaxID=302168 RepID=A0ABN2JIS3_9ACTN
MSKSAKIILFSALGVLVVVAIAVTTVVLVINQNHKNDIAAADKAAADYVEEIAAFRTEQAEILADESSDVAAALDAIEAAADEVPTIGDAPEYGRENSDDYVEAAKAEQAVVDDLDALAELAQASLDTTEFVDAATVALNRNTPQDLLGPGPFSSGQPVRDSTIPAMQAVKDTFEAVEVPAGFEETAELTSAALQHVLDNLNQMAASLDGGQSYFFEFSAQYSSAESALAEATDATEDALADGIEAFGADEEIEAPGTSSDDEESDGGSSDDEAREEDGDAA